MSVQYKQSIIRLKFYDMNNLCFFIMLTLVNLVLVLFKRRLRIVFEDAFFVAL